MRSGPIQTLSAIAIALNLFGGAPTFAAPAEIPVPPMPAAKKVANGVPKLVPAATVVKFVPGLRGHFDAANGIAYLNGRVHKSCVPMMTLAASSQITVENAVPFALMATDDGLKCLERTHGECTADGSCVSFQALSKDPKTAALFKARVETGEKATENVKVTLAKKALVLNDKTVKMEASADCCNLASDPRLGDESPLPAKTVKDLAATRDQLMAKIAQTGSAEPVVPPGTQGPAAIPMPPDASTSRPPPRRPLRSSDDDDDEDKDKDDKKDDSPEAKQKRLPPGIQYVKTDEEIEKDVQKNMQPYQMQYMQSVYQAQIWQLQTQLQMAQFQLGLKNQQTTQTNTGQSLMNFNWGSLSSGLGATPNWITGAPISTVPSVPLSTGFTMPALGGR